MSHSRFHRNFSQLIALQICDKQGHLRPCGKSKSDGFMDLVYERLPMLNGVHGASTQAISIAHYFKMNGDLCQDPEMVLLVDTENQAVKVHSFQQAIPAIYQEVYDDSGQPNSALEKNLNTFLEAWLENLVNQGHGVSWENYQE